MAGDRHQFGYTGAAGLLRGLARPHRRTLRPWRWSLGFHQGLHLVNGVEQL
jgi:hypothetical protein